ncbi:hypothetical protein EWB00_005445 [Schistosoma japonicum]|uniref:Trematode PH-like domain-containing protein n=3 Tax=Schistosoma japonicum TaxID=6182 RepID=A0A4Z2DV41_SCHJA|nr:hypothetical protein EWB00_005445 [Schistosoma japonicum]
MASSSSLIQNNCSSSTTNSGYGNSTLGRTGSLGYIDEVLRHAGTKQHIILQVHVCAIHRTTVRDTSDFSKETALKYIEKYHKRRRSHCSASLLEDRFCLRRVKQSGKVPFHPWIVYNEIKHIFISSTRPEFFALCIESNQDLQKFIEIYKCKSAEDVKQIESKITQAINDPCKLLRNINLSNCVISPHEDVADQKAVIPQIVVQSPNELNNNDEVKKDSKSTQTASPGPQVNYMHLESISENIVSSLSITPNEVADRSSPLLLYPIEQNVVETSLSSDNEEIHLETRIHSILDKVTLIDHNPSEGSRVSKTGNFYMFFDRQEFHLNKFTGCNENSDLSDNEGNHPPRLVIIRES